MSTTEQQLDQVLLVGKERNRNILLATIVFTLVIAGATTRLSHSLDAVCPAPESTPSTKYQAV